MVAFLMHDIPILIIKVCVCVHRLSSNGRQTGPNVLEATERKNTCFEGGEMTIPLLYHQYLTAFYVLGTCYGSL